MSWQVVNRADVLWNLLEVMTKNKLHRVSSRDYTWRPRTADCPHFPILEKYSRLVFDHKRRTRSSLWSGRRGDSPGECRAADITSRATLSQVNFRLKYRTELNTSLTAGRRNVFSTFLSHAASLCVTTRVDLHRHACSKGFSQRLRSPLLSISATETTTIPVYLACLTSLWRTTAARVVLYLG